MHMKKYLIFLSAALALSLTACAQREAETTPTAVPTPEPKPTVLVTPAVSPSPKVTIPPEMTVTPAPTETAAPTPKPVLTPTPAPIQTPTPTQTPEPTPQPVPEPTPEPVPSEPVLPPETSMEPVRPRDEEGLEAYRTAQEAYNWFALATLEAHQDEKVELEGRLYARVADERFPTMDSLRGYLKTLFSDEVVDALLPIAGEQYVEIDGQLYVSEGGRGTDITKGAVTLSVNWPAEEGAMACTVRAEVELLDEETLTTVVGTQIYEFPYQKVGDKWVFTHFEAIK